MKQKLTGSVLSALIVILVLAGLMGGIVYGNMQDPIPDFTFWTILGVLASTVFGILVALGLRIKELKGGKMDEASKY